MAPHNPRFVRHGAPPSAGDRLRHQGWISMLNRGDGFARMSLRGLTSDEVADYIRATANVEPSPRTAASAC